MPRRTIVVALLVAAAVLAVAAAPWTVSSALTAGIARQLRAAYGLELKVGGRSTVALLPVPRLKFEDVTIANRAGETIARGGVLRGEFRIVPLLVGRMELGDASLSGTTVVLRRDASGRHSLEETVVRLRERAEGRSSPAAHVRRFALNGARVTFHDDKTDTDTSFEAVTAGARWVKADGPVELAGSVIWRGETFSFAVGELRPAAALAGTPTRFDARITSSAGTITAVGDVSPDGRGSGRLAVSARSLRDFAHLAGVRFAWPRDNAALSVEGDFRLEAGTVSLAAARVAIGANRLEGALSLRAGGDRPAVGGTLAAEQLDLSDLLLPAADALRPGGGWSGEPIALADTPAVDVDLRVSASAARFGTLKLEELAGGLLVKPGRIEASLGRANLHKGVVKGRLTATAVRNRADIRLLASLEGVELGALAADLGQTRWISGSGQMQVSLESLGESPANLARNAQGRIAISAKQGELIGVALPELLRRVERRPLATSLQWRGGRTPFEQANVTFNVAYGVADVVEGWLAAVAARGTLQGRVSLIDRMVTLRAGIEPVGPSGPAGPAILFDILGPVQDVAVVPDVRALISRSGAARPLLGREWNASATQGLGFAPSSAAQ